MVQGRYLPPADDGLQRLNASAGQRFGQLANRDSSKDAGPEADGWLGGGGRTVAHNEPPRRRSTLVPVGWGGYQAHRWNRRAPYRGAPAGVVLAREVTPYFGNEGTLN
jgi:hypothetical protein